LTIADTRCYMEIAAARPAQQRGVMCISSSGDSLAIRVCDRSCCMSTFVRMMLASHLPDRMLTTCKLLPLPATAATTVAWFSWSMQAQRQMQVQRTIFQRYQARSPAPRSWSALPSRRCNSIAVYASAQPMLLAAYQDALCWRASRELADRPHSTGGTCGRYGIRIRQRHNRR
jgi:hypothetical protein